MRTLIVLLCTFSWYPAAAAAQDQPRTKANLDLPFDALVDEVNEEEPLEYIVFYGQNYEGDGFFFCLDRSSSTAQGELAMEKREAIRVISEFSENVTFGVVFYDAEVMKFPSSGRPAEATTGMKSAAVTFIASIQPGKGTCVAKGLTECLNFANQSPARRNQIILLTDGYTTCPGFDAAEYGKRTLAEITAKNYKRHAIHAICVGTEVSEFFPKTLAAMNNGTYKRINLPR